MEALIIPIFWLFPSLVLAYSPSMDWDLCSPSRIKVTVRGAADGGIIYIKGYGSACKQDTFSVETQHEFIFQSCGIDAETYFTIIIQKNPLYQTGADLQESLLCIYDLSDISLSNSLNVGDKADDDGVNKTVKPTAQMMLYKEGQVVSGGSVKLTDLVTMTIQLDNEFIEDFDIKARHCTANFIDITVDFCSADTGLFPNFQSPTQGAITSTFGAFRTTDLGGGFVEMTFSCTVQVCLGPCTPTACDNAEEGWGRKKRESENTGYDNINVGSSFTVRTDVDVSPTEPDPVDSLCVTNTVFIIIITVITGILITSTALTTYVTNKLMKTSEELRLMSGRDVFENPAENVKIASSTDKVKIGENTTALSVNSKDENATKNQKVENENQLIKTSESTGDQVKNSFLETSSILKTATNSNAEATTVPDLKNAGFPYANTSNVSYPLLRDALEDIVLCQNNGRSGHNPYYTVKTSVSSGKNENIQNAPNLTFSHATLLKLSSILSSNKQK